MFTCSEYVILYISEVRRASELKTFGKPMCSISPEKLSPITIAVCETARRSVSYGDFKRFSQLSDMPDSYGYGYDGYGLRHYSALRLIVHSIMFYVAVSFSFGE